MSADREQDRGPVAPRTLYHVIAQIEHLYEIEAETPEEAADIVESGEASRSEQIDARIDRVTLPNERGEYDPLGDDVRKPDWCAVHKREIRPGGICRACWLGKPAA
jgi:hypothetical protein